MNNYDRYIYQDYLELYRKYGMIIKNHDESMKEWVLNTYFISVKHVVRSPGNRVF